MRFVTLRSSFSPIRFGLLFGLTFLLCVAVVLSPWLHPIVERFSAALVDAAAKLIGLFGGRVAAHGTVLRDPAGGFGVEMKDGCNAVDVTLLLWAAIIAFPARFTHKVQGILFGSLAIQGVNLIRFVSLFYIGIFNARWFEFAHLYLWESLIVLDTMVVFCLWVNLVTRTSVVQLRHVAG